MNESERTARVTRYFKLMKRLKGKLPEEKSKIHRRIFHEMSGRKTRLWYITGCYMAQEIEKHRGTEALRKLVEQGDDAFFGSYFDLAHQ